MFELFTDQARRVIVLAQEEAKRLRHDSIGPEHLLLGLLRDGSGPAAKAMSPFGITLEAARLRVQELRVSGVETPPATLPFTPRARRVIDSAARESRQLGRTYVGAEHILLGLAGDAQGPVAKVLDKLDVPLGDLRGELLRQLDLATRLRRDVPQGSATDVFPADEDVSAALRVASAICRSEGGQEISTLALLSGILQGRPNIGTRALISTGVSLHAMLRAFHYLSKTPVADALARHGDEPALPMSDEVASIMKAAGRAARKEQQVTIAAHQVLSAIMRTKGTRAEHFLSSFELTPNDFDSNVDLVRYGIRHGYVVLDAEAPLDTTLLDGAKDRTTDLPPRAVARRCLASLSHGALTVLTFALLGAAWILLLRRLHGHGFTASETVRVFPLCLFLGGTVLFACALHWRSVGETFMPSRVRLLVAGKVEDESYAATLFAMWRGPGRWAWRALIGVVVIIITLALHCLRSGWSREAVIWLVVSTAVIFPLGVLARLGGTFRVGDFVHPINTRRRLPRAVSAFHDGLSGFAYAVTLVPIMAFVGASGIVADGRQGSYGGVAGLLHSIATSVMRQPGGALVSLIFVPLLVCLLLYRVTLHMTAVDEDEVWAESDMPPILYLRTWESDDLWMYARPCGGKFISDLYPARKMSFSELLGDSLCMIGPVMQVGRPGTQRKIGVGNMWSTDDEWQDLVRRSAHLAAGTVFVASETVAARGFSWEMSTIGDGAVTGRVAIVVPPNFDVDGAWKPGGFFCEAAQHYIFRGLVDVEIDASTRVLCRTKRGTWYAYRASVANALTYQHCLNSLLLDYAEDWSSMAAGNLQLPSPVSIERFLSTVVPAMTGAMPRPLIKAATAIYAGFFWSYKWFDAWLEEEPTTGEHAEK